MILMYSSSQNSACLRKQQYFGFRECSLAIIGDSESSDGDGVTGYWNHNRSLKPGSPSTEPHIARRVALNIARSDRLVTLHREARHALAYRNRLHGIQDRLWNIRCGRAKMQHTVAAHEMYCSAIRPELTNDTVQRLFHIHRRQFRDFRKKVLLHRIIISQFDEAGNWRGFWWNGIAVRCHNRPMRWVWIGGFLLAAVLVPYALLEARLGSFTQAALEARNSGVTGMLVIAGLLALDVLLPIPSSIVATASGVVFGAVEGTVVNWAGLMAGCCAGYGIGRSGAAWVRRFVGYRDIARAQAMIERFGNLAAAVCRPVPVLAEASVVLLGMLGWPFRKFLLWMALSNLGIAAVYAIAGAYAARWDSFLLAFCGSMLLPGVLILLAKRRLS